MNENLHYVLLTMSRLIPYTSLVDALGQGHGKFQEIQISGFFSLLAA